MRYEVAAYHPDLRDDVSRLMSTVWTGAPSTHKRVFKWKYESNPYMPTPLVHVAMADGRIVGLRGAMGSKWHWGPTGESTVIPCAESLAIDPEYRNRGIAEALNAASLRALWANGFRHLINLTANEANFVASRMSGWRSTVRIEQMCWPPLASSGHKKWPRRRGVSFLPRGTRRRLRRSRTARSIWQGRIRADARRIRNQGPPQIIESSTVRPREMSELVDRLDADGRIRHVRDEEYFQWRFGNHPHPNRYRFLYWVEAGLEGYVVLSWGTTPSRIKIADIAAVNTEVWTALIRAAKLCRSGRLEALTGTMTQPHRDILIAEGFDVFSNSPYRPAVLIRPTSSTLSDRSWYLGDRDLRDLMNWDLSPIAAMSS